jgi:hypothetical protein
MSGQPDKQTELRRNEGPVRVVERQLIIRTTIVATPRSKDIFALGAPSRLAAKAT